MATTADTRDIHEALDMVLGRVTSLLHGLFASQEFYSDKNAELKMTALAQALMAEAQELSQELWQSYRGEADLKTKETEPDAKPPQED